MSPVEELRWFEYAQRLYLQARNVLTSKGEKSTGRHLVDHAVEGGAQACARKVGRIEPGYRADLIVLDDEHPLLFGRQGDQLLDSWIFSGNTPVVTDVFVGGKHVIQDGSHPAEGEILECFRKTIVELAE